jgi:hypothetical protein
LLKLFPGPPLLAGTHKRESAHLQGFKGELKQWDLTFWSEQLREAKYNISDEQLRPYFSLTNVLDGLFKVTWFPVFKRRDLLAISRAHLAYSGGA